MIGTSYWNDRDQKALAAKLKAAEHIEAARRDLVAGVVSPETLTYARFLCAVENDATYSAEHGGFRPFRAGDEDVVLEWPFLRPLIDNTKSDNT